MSRVLRSTAKRLAQKLLGQGDVRGFVRTQKLGLSKKLYRRPIAIADTGQNPLGAVVVERVLQCTNAP
jgi:hypothetical protein